MIAAICLGFFGSIFALVGMKCTKIGGSDGSKAKIACLAGVNFVLSGKLSEMVSQSLKHKCLNPVIRPLLRPLLAHRLLPVRTPHHYRVFWPYVCGTEVRAAARAFHVPLQIKKITTAVPSHRYELGAALFIGWAGSVLCIIGGGMLCFSIAGSFTKRSADLPVVVLLSDKAFAGPTGKKNPPVTVVSLQSQPEQLHLQRRRFSLSSLIPPPKRSGHQGGEPKGASRVRRLAPDPELW